MGLLGLVGLTGLMALVGLMALMHRRSWGKAADERRRPTQYFRRQCDPTSCGGGHLMCRGGEGVDSRLAREAVVIDKVEMLTTRLER